LIQFIEDGNCCSITINKTYTQADNKLLEHLFSKNYAAYEVTIATLYTIPRSLVEILKEAQLQHSLYLCSTNGRVVRYLHKLSFDIVHLMAERSFRVPCLDAEVVVIGGSAKSTKQIIDLLKDVDLRELSVVVVQHIGTTMKESFDKLLSQYLNAKVTYAKNGEFLQKNRLYIAPKGYHLCIESNKILLQTGEAVNGAKPSISVTFESFSRFYKEKMIAIVECGYAYDGVDVLQNLQDNGTTVLVQDPSECADADSIPRYALQSHHYDYLLNRDAMREFLTILTMRLDSDEWVVYLLEKIYEKYEYDYREYASDMIKRRIKLFMMKYSLQTMQELVLLLLFNRFAFKLFFLKISINVSEFFRDTLCMQKVMGFLVKCRHNYKIKIWCAGVSQGQEAYSMAILLDLVGLLHKSTIYATDFNPVVVEEAKNGLYSMQEYEKAEENFLQLQKDHSLKEYFTQHKDFVCVNDSLRKNILFFVHDLQSQGTFNEFDFIVCRNVLIYFDMELQRDVFTLLYDSLKFGGYLFLGSNEFLLQEYEERFRTISSECKIFMKVQ